MEFELALRVVAAVALAFPLGWDRERRNRPAGLRTHLLVAMSSALMTVIAELVVRDPRFEDHQLDPLRVLQATATGVSLLCAGTVVVSKGGVHGLTTAASVLAVSALGCAAGLGYYRIAAVCVVLGLLILRGAAYLERNLQMEDEAPSAEPALKR
jgi:putative Mg2+ transporter-C (MgtC) family protein